MVVKQKQGTLPQLKIRHTAYKNMVPLYPGRYSMHSAEVVSSDLSPASRDSRNKLSGMNLVKARNRSMPSSNESSLDTLNPMFEEEKIL